MNDFSFNGELNAEQLYDLVLAATDDEDQASRAASDRAMDRMRQGRPA